MKFCEQCGNSISDERFCPSCGNEIIAENEQTTVESAEPQVECQDTYVEVNQPAPNQVQKFPKNILIIAGVVVLAIVIFVVSLSNNGPKFKKLYDEYCDSKWADVASDGSFLSIDTNPDDEEDTGIAYYAAYSAVENINKALGIPESLFKEMGETTSADGKQSEDFDKINVSWKYHPDKGLEVTYKKK